MLHFRLNKPPIKTYKRKSNNKLNDVKSEDVKPKIRIPINILQFDHTNSSINLDSFKSPSSKSPIPARNAIPIKTTSLPLITSTPAVKNPVAVNVERDDENDADISHILKTTFNQFNTPQKNSNDENHSDSEYEDKLTLESRHIDNSEAQTDDDIEKTPVKNVISFENLLTESSLNNDTGIQLMPSVKDDDKVLILDSIKEQQDKDASFKNKENISEHANIENSPSIKNDRLTLSVKEIAKKSLEPHKMPKKTVGFVQNCDIHELTNNTIDLSHDPSQKLIIKSGKWRRTIYEIRKSKLTCEYNFVLSIMMRFRIL